MDMLRIHYRMPSSRINEWVAGFCTGPENCSVVGSRDADMHHHNNSTVSVVVVKRMAGWGYVKALHELGMHSVIWVFSVTTHIPPSIKAIAAGALRHVSYNQRTGE